MAVINEKGILGRFLVWRVRYIKEKQFVVMLSILVGYCYWIGRGGVEKHGAFHPYVFYGAYAGG